MNNLVKISDIFEIKYGVNLELVNLEQCNSNSFDAMPFVSRTEKNNGVSAYIYKLIDLEPNPGHTLSVAGGGSVLSTFYQPIPYYSGRDLYVLIPKNKMTEIEMLFYAKCIFSNKYKYNYGRQANKTLKDILIPKCAPKELINELFSFKNRINKTLKQGPFLEEKIELNSTNWQSFKLSELFEITGSKTTSKQDLEDIGKGIYPFVTTQASNNAVENFYDDYSEDGNVLTIDSAVIGYCSYQSYKFSASDHVEKLIPKFELNKYLAMFFVTVLNLEQYRYNYGRKASQTRMKQISIKLPAKENKPDFEYMEKYIKTVKYSRAL